MCNLCLFTRQFMERQDKASVQVAMETWLLLEHEQSSRNPGQLSIPKCFPYNGRMRRHTGPGSVVRFVLVGIVLTCIASTVFAQDTDDPLRNLAQRIAEKRSEVESLSNELELMKTDYNEQMRSVICSTEKRCKPSGQEFEKRSWRV